MDNIQKYLLAYKKPCTHNLSTLVRDKVFKISEIGYINKGKGSMPLCVFIDLVRKYNNFDIKKNYKINCNVYLNTSYTKSINSSVGSIDRFNHTLNGFKGYNIHFYANPDMILDSNKNVLFLRLCNFEFNKDITFKNVEYEILISSRLFIKTILQNSTKENIKLYNYIKNNVIDGCYNSAIKDSYINSNGELMFGVESSIKICDQNKMNSFISINNPIINPDTADEDIMENLRNKLNNSTMII